MGAGGPYLGQRVTVDGALRELAVIPSWAGVGRAPVDQVVASIRREERGIMMMTILPLTWEAT